MSAVLSFSLKIGRVCVSLIPAINRLGFSNSKFGCRSNTWRCQRIQFVRWPVSPSGYRFACVPSLDASIRKTASESASGTLPTRRIDFDLLISVLPSVFDSQSKTGGRQLRPSQPAVSNSIPYTHGALPSREAARPQSRKSNIQCPPIGVEHRFLHRFRDRRMREDGVHQFFLGG